MRPKKPSRASKPKLTPEQIKKANARKTMKEMQAAVAASEELWLEFFNLLMPYTLDRDVAVGGDKGKIVLAGELADVALSEYENRWMGGKERRH